MGKEKAESEKIESLREQAEKLVRQPSADSIAKLDYPTLAHELAVHQIELEAQNEELRRAQMDLQESRDRYQDLFDSAPVAYCTLKTASDEILEVNLEASRLLCIDRGELLKTNFPRYINPKSQDEFYFCRRKSLQTATSQSCELELVRKGGFTFWSRVEMLSTNGSWYRVLFLDITERKNIEESLAASYRELEAFSYSVSHDLRAPLRALDGFSDALLEEYSDKLDAKGKNYLNLIRKNTQAMGQLIDDLLKLSRISQTEIFIDRVNLCELAQSIADKLKNSYPEHSVNFECESNLWTKGDIQLLRILLTNLLENSWKYSSKRPDAKIEVGVIDTQREKIYYVKDNGVGFDMTYADKLFKPFQRLHTEREFPGTGIGLAMVQRIVNRHRGRVWAEGHVNQGATFYFTLD